MGIGTVVSSILAMVLSLALVLGLAYGVLLLLRRFQDRSLQRGELEEGVTLRFLRALPLGPRERVVLVEARGETMMLGVTAGAITVLSRWDGDGRPVAFDDALGRARAPLVPPVGKKDAGVGSWR